MLFRSEIDLYVPVEDPALWTSNASLIERMLAFLTGDYWRISFRARQPGLKTLVDKSLKLDNAKFDSVCLFSGGLDSFVGSIDLLQNGKNPLFVSHYWDVSTSSQMPCAKKISEVYGDMDQIGRAHV